MRQYMSDTMISAVVAGEDIYGVAAVTTSVVEQAQRVHGACPTTAAALGRLLTGGALMGCLCKEPEYRIALQIVCKGHTENPCGSGWCGPRPWLSRATSGQSPLAPWQTRCGRSRGERGAPCHEGHRPGRAL